MGTSKEEISDWFDRGVAQGAEFMIVACDTFDHEDYPVYVKTKADLEKSHKEHSENMQRVMEVYSLKSSKEVQMAEHRSFHFEHFDADAVVKEATAKMHLARHALRWHKDNCLACQTLAALAETAPKTESRGIPRTNDDGERRGNIHPEPGTSSPDDAERIPGPPEPPRPPRHRPVGYGSVPPPDEDDAERAARKLLEWWGRQHAGITIGPVADERLVASVAALVRTRDAQARADERSKAPCPHPLEKIDANYICTRCGVEQPALRERDAQAREAGRVEGWGEAIEAVVKGVNDGRNLKDVLRALKRPDRAKGGG